MSSALDETMQQASQALARMNYLGCEALCLDALARAQAAGDWEYFARVLMPLQEARRQRRMIAAEGTILLGTRTRAGDAPAILARVVTGCVVLTRPHTAQDAVELETLARRQRRYVEVLWADNPADATTWTVRSTVAGPPASSSMDAPPADWVDRWMDPNSSTGPRPRATHRTRAPDGGTRPRVDTPGMTPADWFIDASERLGDAALETARFSSGDDQVRFQLLRGCLEVVHDHELIHQALAEAARRLARRA